MDLPWTGLRALRALAERGTMSAAAQALGYSTGAISQQLATLEATAGVPLLRRVGRTVRLTDAGQVLAERATLLLAAQDEARDAVRTTTREAVGTVRLGIFATVAASLLAPVVAALTARHPLVRLRSRELAVDDVAVAVRRGDVDLGLGLDYPDAPIPREDGATHRTLLREDLALMSAPGWDLPSVLTLGDAAGLDWVLPPASTHFGVAVRTACRTAGFEPRAVHEVNDTATSLALAAHGLGATLATPLMLRFAAPGTLRTSTLTVPVQRRVVLIGTPADVDRPAVRAVVEVIEDVVGHAHDNLAGTLHGRPHES